MVAYIYFDEVHSIGAVGKTGRGICELLGMDTSDIDIMIGTCTKSFGSSRGYIVGSKDLIKYLKAVSPGHLYATTMSPSAAQQVISALKVILEKMVQIEELKSLHEFEKIAFFSVLSCRRWDWRL